MNASRPATSRTRAAAALASAPRSRALRPLALLALLFGAGLLTVLVTHRLDAPKVIPLGEAQELSDTESMRDPEAATDAQNPPAGMAFDGAAVEPAVLVHVAGAVQHPGLVTLPVGSRVADAIEAAGGPVAGAALETVNLARRVNDGEQLLVGVPPPAMGADGQSQGAGAPPADQPMLVNLNTATSEQLQQLPRIGPSTAQKILDHRQQNGPFTSVDQLLDVAGIGERTLAGIRDLVQV